MGPERYARRQPHPARAEIRMGASDASHRVPPFKDCGDDIGVSTATAKIAAHILADLPFIAGMALSDTGDCRHDLARRAITALKCIMVDEGLLHGVERTVRTVQPFDGGHSKSFGGGSQGQAR